MVKCLRFNIVNCLTFAECEDKVSRQETIEVTCQVDEIKSEVDSLLLEMTLGEDVSGYCTYVDLYVMYTKINYIHH